MVDADTTAPTQTTTKVESGGESPPRVWMLHVAHHPRACFIGRHLHLPIGAEISLGRGSRIFANDSLANENDKEESAFHDQEVSRDHLVLVAREQWLEVHVAGKNGIKVGLQNVSSPTTIHVGDQSVISIPMTGSPMLIIVRRTVMRKEAITHPEIIGTSCEIGEVIRKIRFYARSSIPILLRGESGSGKDLVARALHREAGGDPSNYRPVNCAELREETLQSELFGHTKGAFTGATSERKGLAESARGGTLFLDEIAEATPMVQAMLLRFLQDKEARRMGSDDVREIDVRIVCASNADFEELIHTRQFRKDLYYRIRGATIEIPPLRDRLDDLPLLAEFFLRRCAGHKKRAMTHQLLRRLLCHSWPGNIRELRSVIETAVAESLDKPTIGLSSEVERRFEESRRIEEPLGEFVGHCRNGNDSHAGRHDAATRMGRRINPTPSIEQVKQAMIEFHGNVVAAATHLKIHRQRVYEVLDNHGLDPKLFRKKS